ncbi:MAG: hypothetical protein IJT33_01310 [Campylobacter sp.]|nr:hypothetical protein [Campylobacter sp.]MBQ7675089.1 hypothetical protein [Campylobacter sp.]MBQ9875903.1 hypothetical protein [Campylobacter sp.]MBR0072060.1 hypothetical protein [Campylobacter sp.]
MPNLSLREFLRSKNSWQSRELPKRLQLRHSERNRANGVAVYKVNSQICIIFSG